MIDIRISNQPLDPEKCRLFIADIEAGGSVVFIGTVRKTTNGKTVKGLDFEAFEPMAVKEMTKIALYLKEHWQALKVCIHHRIGSLDIGEIPVIIAVATPHRDAAFEACKYAIDTLKRSVPIWKKERFEDGEVWVSAHP